MLPHDREAAGHYRFTYVSFAISRILLSVSSASSDEDQSNIMLKRKISVFIMFPCLKASFRVFEDRRQRLLGQEIPSGPGAEQRGQALVRAALP